MFFNITCVFSTSKLALIRLPEKVQFSETIRPAQMPTVCETLENIVVLAVGNGATGRDTISNRLKFAVLKTLPFKSCRKAFPFLKKRESILCAYNDVNYQTISTGDFGGPLISSVDNTLIGISSFLGKNMFFSLKTEFIFDIWKYFCMQNRWTECGNASRIHKCAYTFELDQRSHWTKSSKLLIVQVLQSTFYTASTQ